MGDKIKKNIAQIKNWLWRNHSRGGDMGRPRLNTLNLL